MPINHNPKKAAPTSMASNKDIFKTGLWDNNAGLVQLLGLCPLLAVTGTVINGIGLGIATLVTLVISCGIVSAVRNILRNEIRIPVFVLIIASVVTVIELIMNAWFHELFRILGIFIPLIVTNCAIIGRAESFASKNPVLPSLLDAFAMGLGFLLVLVALGGLRELLGSGTLMANAELMFGAGAASWELSLGDNYQGFLLAILPPGAFFGLGLLLIIKNLIDAKLEQRTNTADLASSAVTQ